MSEVFPRYRRPEGKDLPVAALAQLWQRALELAADLRAQFAVLVVAPTAIAALYFGLVAAPQYVAHTEYIVRGVDAHRSSGLSQLLNTFGVSRAADETSAIESFLKSREVIEKLAAKVNLRAVYGSAAADRLSRFPRFWERDTFEALFNYTRSYIDVTKDGASGVTRRGLPPETGST